MSCVCTQHDLVQLMEDKWMAAKCDEQDDMSELCTGTNWDKQREIAMTSSVCVCYVDAFPHDVLSYPVLSWPVLCLTCRVLLWYLQYVSTKLMSHVHGIGFMNQMTELQRRCTLTYAYVDGCAITWMFLAPSPCHSHVHFLYFMCLWVCAFAFFLYVGYADELAANPAPAKKKNTEERVGKGLGERAAAWVATCSNITH